MNDVVTAGVAVRQGLFYGSPGCCSGRLCTWAAYEQATTEVRHLVADLGPGWKPKVWENLGWHYQAVLSSGEHSIYVHPLRDGSTSQGGWSVTGYGASFDHRSWHDAETPRGAVIAAVAEVRSQMDALGELLSLTVNHPELHGGET